MLSISNCEKLEIVSCTALSLWYDFRLPASRWEIPHLIPILCESVRL